MRLPDKSTRWINTKMTKMMARLEMKRYELGNKEQGWRILKGG